MTRSIVPIIVALSLLSPAAAMEGVFDRSAEIDKYLKDIQGESQVAVTTTLRQIYWSGISDKRLADALNEQLLADYSTIAVPKYRKHAPRFHWTSDDMYGVGLIEALSAMGMQEYNSTFDKISASAKEGGAPNRRMRNEAAAAHKTVAFRAGLNKVMATRENHIEGGDPTTSMLINLLKSNERLYRDFALDRIEREKLNDRRLLDLLDRQILDYVQRAPVKKPQWQETILRRNIKILGFSGEGKYHATMQAVLASSVDEGTKKHAQLAAERLSVPGA